jgi:hypothetical protein
MFADLFGITEEDLPAMIFFGDKKKFKFDDDVTRVTEVQI